MIRFLLVLLSLSACAQRTTTVVAEQSASQLIAFPGAEGFGKYATGGRGGDVYIVQNLNDDGPGSLREAIQKHGPRIITFAVSGTIDLESELAINNNDLTIAGQSAPGDGICLRNYPVRISASNVIIRYMRFRLGDEAKIQGDALGGGRNQNIMIDHCSMSWATDECASFYNNEKFTLQWCIISESLNASVHAKGEHGYGGIWGGRGATFHHNLIAHHTSRLPRFSGSSTTPNSPDELVDFRNNVIYNWSHNNTYGGEKGRYNMINNYYKPGPATPAKRSTRIVNPLEPYGKFYIQGNVLDGNSVITSDNRNGIIADSIESLLVNTPFNVVSLPTQSADEAYESVLAGAGASKERDGVDKRIVMEVSTGTASKGPGGEGIINSQTEAGGWPNLKSGAALFDGDSDGMPDEWERANRLNPDDGSDSKLHTLSKGYTNIEVYLNSLVRY